MQIPILLAICEYGIVLAMKTISKSKAEVTLGGNKLKLVELYHSLDIFTFLLSAVILTVINIVYWSYYN